MEGVEITEAILYPGDFIGLFEVADEITRVPNPPPSRWSIRSGVCNIHAIPNLTTQQNKAKLARKFGLYIGDIGSENTLFDQLLRLPPFHNIAKSWRSRILYFSRSWLDLLQPNTPGILKNLSDNLVRQAWRNSALVRDKDPRRLQQKLRHAAANHNETADAAGLFFKTVEDVLDSRQPFYVPLNGNSLSGPFGDISDQILSVATDQNSVLCPTYMAANARIGYLKLEQLVPSGLGARMIGGIKSRVLDMMNVLMLAHTKEPREAEDGEIASYVKLLNNLTFQSPGVGGSPSIYMMRFDQRTSSVLAQEFPILDFYGPHFSTPPNERCAFFRSSVQIDGRALTEMAS